MKKKLLSSLCSYLFFSVPGFLSGADLSIEWEGWQPYAPREELRPDFSLRKKGGPDGKGGLVIRQDAKEGLFGAWSKTFDVEGDVHYRVTALAKNRKVENARANRYVEIFFHGKDGKKNIELMGRVLLK